MPSTLGKGTLDFAYLTRLRKGTENAAGLLNLAKGRTGPGALVSMGDDAPLLLGRTGVNMYGTRAGSLNAESTMTSVALLAQRKTNPALFEQNLKMIKDAQAASGASPITDQVGIRIVSKRSTSRPPPNLLYAVEAGTGKMLGAFRLMKQPPHAGYPERLANSQEARNRAFNAYVLEHLVI